VPLLVESLSPAPLLSLGAQDEHPRRYEDVFEFDRQASKVFETEPSPPRSRARRLSFSRSSLSTGSPSSPSETKISRSSSPLLPQAFPPSERLRCLLQRFARRHSHRH